MIWGPSKGSSLRIMESPKGERFFFFLGWRCFKAQSTAPSAGNRVPPVANILHYYDNQSFVAKNKYCFVWKETQKFQCVWTQGNLGTILFHINSLVTTISTLLHPLEVFMLSNKHIVMTLGGFITSYACNKLQEIMFISMKLCYVCKCTFLNIYSFWLKKLCNKQLHSQNILVL